MSFQSRINWTVEHKRWQKLPPLLRFLIERSALTPKAAFEALESANKGSGELRHILRRDFGVSEAAIAECENVGPQVQRIDLEATPPDARLAQIFGAAVCVPHQILPWRMAGENTIVLISDVNQIEGCKAALESAIGPVKFALASKHQILQWQRTFFDDQMIFDAERMLPRHLSCRGWAIKTARRFGLVLLLISLAAAAIIPKLLMQVIVLWVLAVLACSTLLKLGALLFARQEAATDNGNVSLLRHPRISLLVPLYRETKIADHLVARLLELDYPKDHLDVCLITEDDDTTTKDTLKQVNLPAWMRIISTPSGTLRTKPRALNFALNFTRGSIIGVYDAEDAPEPAQLSKVAQYFATADKDVACVQGTLDYYNPSDNWLARCFTIEYASWFRVILPGLARMGLIVPLGGTTLFFRRDILEKLGAWDAHNVTEDADLGIRLARKGYRTVFLPTVTCEEANARPWAWVKQRSRWLKGYAVTYLVHMRRPLRLIRDIGLWRFFGFQILFLGTLSQFLLAPVIWSFVATLFGYGHPFLDGASPAAFWGITALFLFSAAVNLAAHCMGSLRAGKPWLIKWAPTLMVYFPLGTLAAIKGVMELFWKPFYWDKTQHGVMWSPYRPRSAFSASKRNRIS